MAEVVHQRGERGQCRPEDEADAEDAGDDDEDAEREQLTDRTSGSGLARPLGSETPLGCSAKPETKISVMTTAPMIGATGDSHVASRPTMKGPKTKTTSSAADS